jgi:hypothetical protein
VLRKIFGHKFQAVTGVWRQLRNKKLHNLYFSANVIKMAESRSDEICGEIRYSASYFKQIVLSEMTEYLNMYKILYHSQNAAVTYIYFFFTRKVYRSRGSSGSIVSDYGLDDRGSIPDRGRGFSF